MAWYSNPWFPWNWPGDVSKALMSQIEHAVEYLFAQLLNTILAIVSDIFGFLMSVFQGIMQWIVNLAISMGPLSVPIFVIITATMIGVGYLAFALVKDVPVVSALA
jgi:phage-related protein